MTAPSEASYRSNAKVNPVLKVLGRREDGLHDLETLLLGLGLGGVVTVRRAPDAAPGSLTVRTAGAQRTPDIVDGPTHLALRGAAAARELVGETDVPLFIDVDKSVPSQAGLGGGSADAAAAAFATLEVLGAGGDTSARRGLVPALAALGVDCAFFAAARGASAAIATGAGDEVRALDGSPSWHVALVTPDVACPTADVYGALGLQPGQSVVDGSLDPSACATFLGLSAADAREHLVNDLEPAALRAVPALGAWLDLVDEACGPHFCLAGSGASLFGLFDDQGEAVAAVESILRAARERSLRARFACVTSAERDLIAPCEGPGGNRG